MIPLCVPPFILFLVLVSSTSGDQHFREIVALCRPPTHQDWGRARTAGNRLARDDKELGGKQLHGERPRETAEMCHTSPAGLFGGKAQLR